LSPGSGERWCMTRRASSHQQVFGGLSREPIGPASVIPANESGGGGSGFETQVTTMVAKLRGFMALTLGELSLLWVRLVALSVVAALPIALVLVIRRVLQTASP
jgi:hypothetical protein